ARLLWCLVVPDAQRAAGFAPDLPLDPFKAWMEMFHRYIASGLGLVALALVWMAWKNRKIPGYPVIVSWVLLGIICLQGAFGAWTVTLQLWPQVVTLHLLGGFTVLATFFWLHYRVKACRQADKRPIRLPGLWCLVGLLLVVQVALGGWTSSNYAGIACTGFPTCNNEWWPDYMDFDEGFHLTQEVGPNYLYGQLHAGARTAIHYTHRLGALALGLGLFVLLLHYKRHTSARPWLLAAVVTYLLQVSLGIILVLSALPLSVALLHTAGAALLMLLLLRSGLSLGISESTSQAYSYRKVVHA
ncbi:COX15/CtaA family protein, partial [Nitrincola sp. A-D6]|uniref:COX15/CtaA family protein n=1 Tax=Nitrincola sp. A-D6 TaxID=1545442 RepID=UPI001F44562E